MRTDRMRLVRRSLLALLVIVSAAVAWSLRRPGAHVEEQAPRPGASPPQGTTVADGALMRFKEGRRKVAVRWRTMAGREGDAMRLEGVQVTVPFVARGEEQEGTITADQALYTPSPLRVSFRGNVRVTTQDGFELETESLKYWDEEGRAFTRDPVRFRRGKGSGSADQMDYTTAEGLWLGGNVKLRSEEEAGPPLEVESNALRAHREQRLLAFEGPVVARQGSRELRAQNLELNLTDDLRHVTRALAKDDVDVRSGPAETVPGAPAGGGSRRLRCHQLEVLFREKEVLQQAIATRGAVLEIEPGPGDPPERRRVAAPQLRFGFDEQGRLESLAGQPLSGEATRQAELSTEPTATGGKAGPRRVRADRFTAALDPASGGLRRADFDGRVALDEPGRRGESPRATYEDGPGLLLLEGGSARIVDTAQGSDLRARQIRLGTRSRSLQATGDVRHTVARAGERGIGPIGGEEPTVLLCRQLDYDDQARAARYSGNALMRSGKDEIRAPLIVLEEPAPGRRRLHASGGVQSLLHPRPEKGSKKEPGAVDARSREMVYEEAAKRVVYTGDVEIRQGDILTKSPEAVVVLGADGRTMQKLLAGAPVDVVQGTKRASGERGTYTPADETLVLVGEKVVLQDTDRRLQGRILTFQVGSDRIRVDGREEARTEAVFKRKDPPKP